MSKSAPRKKRRKSGFTSPGRSRVSLGITALGFLVALILLGKLISAITHLNQPYSPDTPQTTKEYSWKGKGTINIVVKAENLYLLSFNAAEKTITTLKIPEDTYLNLPLNFGRWPARSVYNLGQAESPPLGAELLKKTVSSVTGLPVDGYLLVPENLQKKPFSQFLEEDLKSLRSTWSLFWQSKTDLSAWEILRLWWSLRGVRADKINALDLGQSRVTQSILLPDGSRVLGIDQILLDQFIRNKMEDSQIKDDRLSIGIFNATNYPGLAEKAGRLISNMGGRVIFTTNFSNQYPKTVVLGGNSYTLARLGDIFAPSCPPTRKKIWLFNLFKSGNSADCNIENLPPESSRADINIVLGEDYFLRYNSK